MTSAPSLREQKKTLRSHYRKIRRDLDPVQIKRDSARIWERVSALKTESQRRQVHLLYVGIRGEVDTQTEIADRHQKSLQTFLPRITKLPGEQRRGLMEFLLHADPKSWQRGPMGLLEPAPDAARWDPEQDTPAIVIVPGLAFDRQGGRLGQGGGFYDHFLQQYRAHISLRIGVCFAEQLADRSLPMADFDQRVDWVISPHQNWIID